MISFLGYELKCWAILRKPDIKSFSGEMDTAEKGDKRTNKKGNKIEKCNRQQAIGNWQLTIANCQLLI
jgi:hypothetical protein